MKRTLLLGGLTLAMLVPAAMGCASNEEDTASADGAASLGIYNAGLAKTQGRKTTDLGKGDFCTALKRIPGAAYRADDEKKEDKLCSSDFYLGADDAASKLDAVALCPKLISTNPGTDVYEIPDGQTKEGIEAQCSNLTALGQFSKIGKFKSSLWCSHTGAILSAYHVSRALGDVVGVPAAVLRTMDKVSHRTIVDKGAKLTAAKYSNPNTFIRRNWNALWPCLHDGRSDCGMPGTPSASLYIRGPALWDQDVQASGFKSGHLVGAFMGNASEDGNYPGITTQDSLRANKRYVALTQSAGIAFEKSFAAETVQGILAMKDIADFLILDTIIEQQDRFSDSGGNLSQKKYLVWNDNGTTKSERADKKKDAPDDALTISRMVIEDNDCGLRKGMRKLRGYDAFIAGIKHLAPSTYTGLQNLASTIDDQQAVFTQGMAMSSNEFARLSENVKFVAQNFADKCNAGTLKLDLDVDAYVKGEIPSCK